MKPVINISSSGLSLRYFRGVPAARYLLALLLFAPILNGCPGSESGKNGLSVQPEIADRAIRSVIRSANQELTRPHVTLIPAGSHHNVDDRAYVSLATYWWPDPNSKNGLPYIRKDGMANPETMTDVSNLPQLIKMARRIEVFVAAFRFTGNEIYAKKAIEQLKVWFVNPETSMPPHLEHAQLIRGVNSGRSYGVIDGWWLVRVIDSIPLLRESGHWSPITGNQIKAWFTAYVNWLQNSEFGLKEKQQKNNHGTWYDVQVVVFSQFIGRNQFVKEYLDTITRPRISDQILFSGKQKFEVSRTRPVHYSIYNLYGLMKLAGIADRYSLNIREPDYLFSGNLLDALRVVLRQVEGKNPDSFALPPDETDTARIWYLLLLESGSLYRDHEIQQSFETLMLRYPCLHSRMVSANPDLFIHLTRATKTKVLR